MLRNYLLTALRSPTRHRLYSFINIAGLAVGLACAIFIVLFIRDELSFDRWVPGADRLYRVESSYAFPGRPVDNFASVTFPLSAAMTAHIPAVQAENNRPSALTVCFSKRRTRWIRISSACCACLSGFKNGHNILINEAAARYLGFTAAAAVGKIPIVGGSQMHVVGVLANANIDGVQTVVPPVIFYNNPNSIELVSVRARSGQDVQALAAVDRIWHRFAPGLAIERHFLDDSFDRLFATDERQGRMFGVFVGIAVFIACLGLFGLAAFSAERRTAEIGVRKVFGARTSDVVRLLLWQFSIPVLIANIVAWPVAWYWLHTWLESYAYRIALSPAYFFAAGAAALVIAWVTVIGHSLAVARANPVQVLRYE